MKYIYIALILGLPTPTLAAENYSRPTEQCLANIVEAMKSVGTSSIESENVIDFEGFLDINGDNYTFMYYKQLAGSKGLDIEGKGSVDLVIKDSSEFQELTDISDCAVSNPKVLEEIQD